MLIITHTRVQTLRTSAMPDISPNSLASIPPTTFRETSKWDTDSLEPCIML
jgi:hypothetical protein